MYYRIKYLPSPSGSNDFNYKFCQALAMPFTLNNITWDENNIPFIWNKSSSSYEKRGQGTTSSNSAYIYNEDNTSARYAYKIIYSTYDLSSYSTYIEKLNTTQIYGKFKPNTQGKFYTYNISGVYILKCTVIKPSTSWSNNYKYFMLTGVASSKGNVFPKINNSSNTSSQSYKYAVFSKPSNGVQYGDFNTPSDIIYYDVRNNISDLILDFGTPQEVPQVFYDWFIQNFDRVYENIYTIKSTTGSTLTTLTEAPPMISATLSAVGNAKYLTLKGENNTNYTMEWTSETPQGKIFAGLATSKGGSIAIPVGETVTINLTDSTDLYEVWQTYRPPTTTFEIKTYNYSGETSRVDKTDYLTPISTLSGVLRGEASLLNFNVLIQSDTVPNFNYCYIDKFKRYYYVTEPVSVRQNLWEMTMQVDALMTYKDSLLKCEGYIDRNEYIQNKMIIDNNRAIMQGADFEEDTITNELFGSGSFVLSGLRIGTKEK